MKQGQQVIGNRVRTRVVKNKVAPPFRTAEFDMLFTGRRMGISREGDILDLGAEMSVLKKMGAFYSFGELRLGQGRENARTFLIDNPELTQEIEGLIRTAAAAAAVSPTSNGAKPAPVEAEEEGLEDGEEEA